MTNTQNVKYAKFKISDLFEYKRGKESAPKRVPAGNIPFISETSENNGFVKMGYSKHTFSANSISVSVNYAQTVFLQPKEFCASVNIIVLVPKFKLEFKPALLYFVALLRQNNSIYSYAYKISKERLMNTEVSLPVTPSGTPDFEYMEERIRELEEERIRELEAYLQVTGLSDATLTKADQDALDKMNMGGVKQAKFKVGNLFDIHPTKAYKMTNRLLMDSEGTTPVLTNTSANNGIGGYSKLKPTEEQPIITFSDTTTGGDTLFVQTRPFIGYSHVQGMYPITEHKWTVKEMLYFISSLRQAAGDGWSYANKFTRDKVSKLDMLLPVTPSGDIDFDFMENYITAIEKQSIRGVIEYKDKVIQTTKDVVNAN